MKLLVLAALLLAPRVVDACTCAMTGVEVLPSHDDAPTNSRVRVFLPPGDWATDVKNVTVKLMEKKAVAAAAEPVVTKKGKKGKKKKAPPPPPPPKAVDVDRADLGSGELRVVELTPKSVLAPRTTYVVTLAVAGGRDEVVGEFKTGGEADVSPPSFAGVTKATLLIGTNRGGMCTGPAFARLEVADAFERGAVFGVWLAGADGTVKYDQPPLTYVPARGPAIRLGHHSICAPRNFDLPKDATEVVVGVRLYDAAGNVAETAAEAVLKAEKLGKK